MDQAIQVVGAVLVLAAFVGAQANRLTPSSVAYLVMNLVGSIGLLLSALVDTDVGFILLESVWALAAAYGLIRRRQEPARS